MRFVKVAFLASLATPIISSPLNSNTNEQHAVALAAGGMAKQPAAHKPALVARRDDDTEEEPEETKDDDDDDNDEDAQNIRELNFAKSFLAALDQFIRDSAATQDPENTDSSLIAAPLVAAMNATINELISPSNVTVSWTNATETAEKKKGKRQNSSWEFSHGRRLPPCPGWPAKKRYNATHTVEWDFFSGTTYEPINPKCPVSNGHVGVGI